MRINTNVSALMANDSLSRTQTAAADSMAKLSSGFRINKAADDAAGLGIANKLQADTRSLTQASRNAEQANSLLGVAEGSANTIQSILQRMKELATEAGSDSVDQTGRTQITNEYAQLRQEIQRTTATTQFNGVNLIDGTFSNAVDTNSANSTVFGGTLISSVGISGVAPGTFKIATAAGSKVWSLQDSSGNVVQKVTVSSYGAQSINFNKFGITANVNSSYAAASVIAAGTNDAIKVNAGSGGTFLIGSSGNYTTSGTGDNIQISNTDLTTDTLGLTSGGGTTDIVDLSTSSSTARTALAVIDTALKAVNSALGAIGAAQNRVTYGLDNAKTAITNYTAAQSVIRDVDMATEMTTFSKNNILAQAGTAMLAQANQAGQSVLKLLQ